MTSPDGKGWIEDVHVYPKNESLLAEKLPGASSVNVGEELPWFVISSVPTDIKNFKKFNITDKMSEALDYVNGSVIVTALASKDAQTGTDLTETEHWTSNLDTDTNTLSVIINADGRAALEGFKFVRISFKTIVNEKLLNLENNSVTNSATISTTDGLDQDSEINTPGSKAHAGSIRIDKIDANSDAALEGAEFQIASSAENAENAHFIRKTSEGKIVDYGDADYDEALEWKETTALDGEKAYATFAGIKDCIEDASGNKTYLSYWVVETKAPAGYNLLSSPVQVTFSASNSTQATSFTATQEIKNTTGFTLPQTGGIGAVLFTVGGIFLVGIAVIILITTHKNKAQSTK